MGWQAACKGKSSMRRCMKSYSPGPGPRGPAVGPPGPALGPLGPALGPPLLPLLKALDFFVAALCVWLHYYYFHFFCSIKPKVPPFFCAAVGASPRHPRVEIGSWTRSSEKNPKTSEMCKVLCRFFIWSRKSWALKEGGARHPEVIWNKYIIFLFRCPGGNLSEATGGQCVKMGNAS